MALRNDSKRYGWLTIAMHWIVALTVVALFTLGLWMVELDYYSTWYKTAPYIHKSIGLLLLGLMLIRLFWRFTSVQPEMAEGMTKAERKLAHLAHGGLYLLIYLVMIAGYLISTADGRAIEVFNWFEVPAVFTAIENQEDIAGKIHFILAISLVVLASLHALAAFKHHFINKDDTLKKMFGRV